MSALGNCGTGREVQDDAGVSCGGWVIRGLKFSEEFGLDLEGKGGGC